MKERTGNFCKGCIWTTRIDEKLVFCPFPKCISGKLNSDQMGTAARGQDGKGKREKHH